MKEKYKVAIIGAGRIAAGFDTPKSRNVLTHAHAVINNKHLTLAGITDTDEARGKKEARKWGTGFFADALSMLKSVKLEIVVIATPDDTHVAMLELVCALSPKLIICEKPIQQSREDGARIKAITWKIPVLVNYRRRFDPTVIALRDDLLKGTFGKVISVVGYYSGGLLHNGSHMIDLARFLFGEMISHTEGRIVRFERCPQFHLIESGGRAYAIFECDILTEKGRIRFVDEGFELQKQSIISDPVFAGYQMLGKYTSVKTGLIDSMKALASHAVAVIDGSEENRSTLENAIITENTCFQLQADA